MTKNFLRKFVKEDLRPNETMETKLSRLGNLISGIIFYSFTTSFLFWNFYDSP